MTAIEPTTTTTTSAPAKRAGKLTWVNRQSGRLARALKEVTEVQRLLASVEQKQAERHQVDVKKLLDDVKETVGWVAGMKTDVDKLPRLFQPHARTRTPVVYSVGEQLVLRAAIQEKNIYGVPAGEVFTITSVDKQTVGWTSAGGKCGVTLLSHFHREGEEPKVTASGAPRGRKRKTA
jgi:hypothetical protein